MKLTKVQLFDLLKICMPGVETTLEQCKYHEFEDMAVIEAVYGDCPVEICSFAESGWQRLMVFNSNKLLLRGEMVKLSEDGLELMRDDITKLFDAEELARDLRTISGEDSAKKSHKVVDVLPFSKEDDELPFPEVAKFTLSEVEPEEALEEPEPVAELQKQNLRLSDENKVLKVEVELLKAKMSYAGSQLYDIVISASSPGQVARNRRLLFLARAALRHLFSRSMAYELAASGILPADFVAGEAEDAEDMLNYGW